MEKKELKDLVSGIYAVRTHIHHLRNQHRDNVGAQFFLNLCEQGIPQTIDFMTRFSEYGIKLELKPNELAALEKAAKATTMNARTGDLGIARNTGHHLINRRNLLILAGTSIAGGSAIVWSRGKTAVGEAIEEVSEIARLERRRKFDEIAAEIIDESKPFMQSKNRNAVSAHGKIDEEKLLSAISERLRSGEEKNKNQNNTDDFIKSSLTGLALAAAFAYAIFHVSTNVYQETNNKKARIIEDLDQFCRYKLDRLPTLSRGAHSK